jgi:hypothetical protein
LTLVVAVGLSPGCSDPGTTTTIEEALSQAIVELAPAHIFDPPEVIPHHRHG